MNDWLGFCLLELYYPGFTWLVIYSCALFKKQVNLILYTHVLAHL